MAVPIPTHPQELSVFAELMAIVAAAVLARRVREASAAPSSVCVGCTSPRPCEGVTDCPRNIAANN